MMHNNLYFFQFDRQMETRYGFLRISHTEKDWDAFTAKVRMSSEDVETSRQMDITVVPVVPPVPPTQELLTVFQLKAKVTVLSPATDADPEEQSLY